MFFVHKTDDGRTPAAEYMPAGAIIPKVGMALVADANGNLVAATGANKPTYICMVEKEVALTAGDEIPVIRVSGDMIFETVSSVAMTSVKRGEKVTLSTDGMAVTATKTDGVAEVVDILDTASGGRVHVRF